MDVRRLVVSFLIALGPLAAAYTYATVSSLGTVGAGIGATMILWPTMVVTPFLVIAGVAYYFMDQ